MWYLFLLNIEHTNRSIQTDQLRNNVNNSCARLWKYRISVFKDKVVCFFKTSLQSTVQLKLLISFCFDSLNPCLKYWKGVRNLCLVSLCKFTFSFAQKFLEYFPRFCVYCLNLHTYFPYVTRSSKHTIGSIYLIHRIS